MSVHIMIFVVQIASSAVFVSRKSHVCKDLVRCHVGQTKTGSLAHLLNLNYTVYFFDLDVFIKKVPLLDLQVDGHSTLVSMFNSLPHFQVLEEGST